MFIFYIIYYIINRMIYDAKIIGVETHSDSVLYKLRIIN